MKPLNVLYADTLRLQLEQSKKMRVFGRYFVIGVGGGRAGGSVAASTDDIQGNICRLFFFLSQEVFRS